MKLADVHRTFHEVVRSERSVEAGADALQVDPRRLGIYRNFVRQHVRTALEHHYPTVQALLGESAWERLYEAYVEACPPTSWELNAAAAAFPEFIEERLDSDGPLSLFHAALARFEWEQYAVNTAPIDLPDPATLSEPVLNPTLSLLQLPFAVVPFVVAFDAGRDPALPDADDAAPLALLFRRPATGNCAYYNGSDTLMFALKVTHDGLSAEAAAAASGQGIDQVRAALDEAADIGLVIRPA